MCMAVYVCACIFRTFCPSSEQWSTFVVEEETCNCVQPVEVPNGGEGDDTVKQLVLLQPANQSLNMDSQPFNCFGLPHI
uniref:Uncharacterized protein n=1 Tax=Anguilla anguilla TaxID=7936 RepID=A0A0E9RCG4_ANGAN